LPQHYQDGYSNASAMLVLATTKQRRFSKAALLTLYTSALAKTGSLKLMDQLPKAAN
jgi:hypothetical protein